MTYKAIVIGVSAGGLNALRKIFSILPEDFKTPLIIVQHVSPNSNSEWIGFMNNKSRLHLKEADEKEKITSGHAYFAPPNYHLLIEKNQTFSLTIDERVNFSRPSIDVLFESAAEAYHNKLIGIVLTGANNDGTAGLKKIKEAGGLTIVQDPLNAEVPYMPQYAIAIDPDYILPLDKIIELLIMLDKQNSVVL